MDADDLSKKYSSPGEGRSRTRKIVTRSERGNEEFGKVVSSRKDAFRP
jgi:hypothetical protein